MHNNQHSRMGENPQFTPGMNGPQQGFIGGGYPWPGGPQFGAHPMAGVYQNQPMPMSDTYGPNIGGRLVQALASLAGDNNPIDVTGVIALGNAIARKLMVENITGISADELNNKPQLAVLLSTYFNSISPMYQTNGIPVKIPFELYHMPVVIPGEFGNSELALMRAAIVRILLITTPLPSRALMEYLDIWESFIEAVFKTCVDLGFVMNPVQYDRMVIMYTWKKAVQNVLNYEGMEDDSSIPHRTLAEIFEVCRKVLSHEDRYAKGLVSHYKPTKELIKTDVIRLLEIHDHLANSTHGDVDTDELDALVEQLKQSAK